MKNQIRILVAALSVLLVLGLVAACKKDPDPVAKSSAKTLSSFTFGTLNPAVTGSISGNTITATVPFGTNVTALAPTIGVSDKATVSPGSGVARDFSSAVTYTVTAEDGSTAAYTVNVGLGAAPKSSAKDITAFAFNGLSPAAAAAIDAGTKTILAIIPATTTTDLTKLVPTISVSPKATVSPATGAAQDFSKAVTYTVTAEDGSTQVYTTTVKVVYPTSGLVAYYPFNGNAKDESGKGIDGILLGPVLTKDRKGGSTCYYFDGLSNILFTQVPTTVTDSWSISLWVNTPSLNQLATFVSVGFDNGTKGDGYSIGMGSGPDTKGDVIQGIFGGVAAVPFNTGIAVNKWFHFVMVRQNGKTSLYKSGIFIITSAATATPTKPTYFTIGSNTGGGSVSRNFKGSLDDIRIYDRALTGAEIEALSKE